MGLDGCEHAPDFGVTVVCHVPAALLVAIATGCVACSTDFSVFLIHCRPSDCCRIAKQLQPRHVPLREQQDRQTIAPLSNIVSPRQGGWTCAVFGARVALLRAARAGGKARRRREHIT